MLYENKNTILYLKKLFDSSIFVQTITKLYDYKIYKWAKEYTNHTNYVPFRHLYGLLSVAITIDILSFNEIYMKKLKNRNNLKVEKTVFLYLLK